MDVVKHADNWSITSPVSLTDEEAQALTFRADPKQVVLGDLVTVTDPEGTRIGHVASATYHDRSYGPAYVVVTIELH